MTGIGRPAERTGSQRADVEVFVLAVDDAGPTGTQVLSPDECARAARLRRPLDRRRYERAHTAVREVLAVRLGVLPAAVPWRTGPGGRPEVVGGPWVSLSHGGGLSVLAVCADHPIGVDVESTDRRFDALAVTRAVATAAELDGVSRSGDRRAAALRLWTLKEAIAKATGCGMGDHLRSVATPEPDGQRSRTRTSSTQQWDLLRPAVPRPWLAALACAPGARVHVRDHRPPRHGDDGARGGAGRVGQGADTGRCMP